MIGWMMLALAAATSPTAPPPVPVEPPAATPSAAGCTKTTCSLGDNARAGFDEAEFVALLDQWATEPLGESTLALDTLLFDAEQSLHWLAIHEDRLPPERRDWLYQELNRQDVVVEMRIVDETGAVRGDLSSGAFSLREKQHLPFQNTGSLGWLETGGKVKRVGLAHLWSRW